MDYGLQPTDKELDEDYFRCYLVNQKGTDITEDGKLVEEQAGETVPNGKDCEKFENGGEIHVNGEGGDNGRKRYNERTPKKARIEDKNGSNPDEIPCLTVDVFEHPNHDEKVEFDEWLEIGLQENNK